MSQSAAKRAPIMGWRISNFYVRLILFSTALVVVATGISSLIVLQLKSRSLEETLGNELLAIVNSTAAAIDGDLHDKISRPESGEIVGLDQFNTIRRHLLRVKQNNRLEGNGSPIYTMRKAPDFAQSGDLEFVVMTDRNQWGHYFIGNRYHPQQHNLSALNGTPSVTGIYTDSQGTWISASAPIYDSAGTIVGIVQADRPVHFFYQRVRKQAGPLIVGAIISVLLASLLALLFARRMVKPIEQLVKAIDRLARGDLKYRVSIDAQTWS
jgi:sensor histidine kinase regulating citrate/malate metabolism